MADSVVSPAPKKSRRWLRRLTVGAGALLALLIVTYFVVTSAGFFKGVILPKVGAGMHATITVADARISPFSQVRVRGLRVQTTGAEPLVTADEARVRYSLWAILGGNLKVAEVILESPTVTVVRNADGTSNLDPIMQSATNTPGQAKPPAKPESSEPGRPPQVDLAKIALNNATFRLITKHAGTGRDLVELSKVNLALDNLKNNHTGKLAVTADLTVDNQSGTNPPASLQGKLQSSFDLSLGSDLSLAACQGGLRFEVPQASGGLSQVNGFSLSFQTDFGANPAKQSAALRVFKLDASRQGKVLLQAALSNPLTFSWGGGNNSASDASLSLLLTNLNLADLKGFAPDADPAGQAHATVQLTSQQSGKRLGLTLAARIEGLGAKAGTNTLKDLDLTLSATGGASDLQRIELTGYRLALARQGTPLASIDGRLVADRQRNTEAEARLEAHLQNLLALFPQPGLSLKSGMAQLELKASTRGQSSTAEGALRVHSLAGNFGERPFQDLSVRTLFKVAVPTAQQIDLTRVAVELVPTERAKTNALELSGRLDLTRPNALEGGLKLAAETLDLTPYYDLFAESQGTQPASSPPGQPAPRESQPPATPTQPETEPPALSLPVKLITADSTIRHCYLRELDLSDVVASARIESNRVTLKPVTFSLNGAPVTAAVNLDLGVAGYQYEVEFNANRLPLQPIADSFSPAYRGRAKGDVLAALSLKGAGVTGPSLQKNLGGFFNLSFTNAEIQLVGPKVKALLTPIALGLGYPDLFKSPLRWVAADAKVADGKLQLNQFSLVSPAFTAGTRGEIPLAAKLAESPIRNWPVEFALPRSVAQKLKLAPKDGTNEFVALPKLVTAVGTLGNAQTKTDPVALLQFGARALAELPGVSPEATKLLNQADNLLGGRLTGKTNAPSTNAPSTNAPSTNALPRKLGDLLKPKPK